MIKIFLLCFLLILNLSTAQNILPVSKDYIVSSLRLGPARLNMNLEDFALLSKTPTLTLNENGDAFILLQGDRFTLNGYTYEDYSQIKTKITSISTKSKKIQNTTRDGYR